MIINQDIWIKKVFKVNHFYRVMMKWMKWMQWMKSVKDFFEMIQTTTKFQRCVSFWRWI